MAPPWLEEVFGHADLGPLIFDTKKMGIIRRNRLAQTCKELYPVLLPSFQETGAAVKKHDRERVVTYAAGQGLETVFLESYLELGCPLTCRAAKAAAKSDKLGILAFIAKLHPVWVYETIGTAAKEGSADCLDYALRLHDLMITNHPDKIDSAILVDSRMVKDALVLAAINHQPDALRVFYQFGFFMTKRIVWHAVRSNRTKALPAMLSMNVEKDVSAVGAAAQHSSHGTLKFLKDNGWPFPLDNRLPCRAAEFGSLKCLQYLELQGCNFDADVTMKAAIGGELGALMHLRERGVPWDDSVVTAAVCNGHKHILQYALPNGCPYNLLVVGQEFFRERLEEHDLSTRAQMDKAFRFLSMFDRSRQ
jgi:hypothetical protein